MCACTANNIVGGVIMNRMALICAVIAVFAVLLMSCAKLSESPPSIEGGLKMETAECGGSIPAAWGDMVSVSSVSRYPGWLQVWFQDKDGTIYMIPYQVDSNTFHSKYRYLRRQ